ncbi:MAG TPA: DUF4139 domain-containing protein [Vineibacter sp.]|nr:DUF4139 domain-containing protein [Vineibacter sp.]
MTRPKNSSRRRLTAVAGLTAALLASTSALAQELALKRVMLSSGGVGYFEYEAAVENDATLKLTVNLDQVDDVLKSLVVYDDKGGVGGLSLPGREPLSQVFRDLPFDQSALASPAALLNALRGAEISVGGPRTATGRVVAVNPEPVISPEGRQIGVRNRVMLMTDKGLQQFVLEEAENLQFADPAVRTQVQKALAAIASNRAKDARTVELTSKGQGKRTVRVAYIVTAPVWKASYRLTVPGEGDVTKAHLQGWAVVENMSGQDWKDVDLTLVSGHPIAFRQALYQSYYVDRPYVPVDVVGRLMPKTDQGTMPAPPPPPSPAPAAPVMRGRDQRQMTPDGKVMPYLGAPGAAPMSEAGRSDTVAAPADQVAAQEALTQVSFRFPNPVTVGNGLTLSVPIINGEVPVKRQALYQPETHARNPLASVRLQNDGNTGLPPGVVTIYERAGGQVAYVGDARLAALPAGENRLLSYALDQKVTVNVESTQTETLVKGSIVQGVLRYEMLQRQTVTYRVKAPAKEDRQLLAETPKLDGWKLVKPVTQNVGQIEGKYRIPFDLKGGETQTFEVVQELVALQELELLDGEEERIAFFAKAKEFDQKTRDALNRIIQLQGAVRTAEKKVEQGEAQRTRIAQEQQRIRENLKSVPANSDLQRRYLATLDKQETELETLARQRADAEKAVDTARAALEAYIRTLG